MSIATPDPRPAKRVVDPRAGVEKCQLEGRCRACGRIPTGHPLDKLNRAHLVSRGAGGDDLDENIVPLCGSGTTGCHGRLHSHERGWRVVASALRRNLLHVEIQYVLRKRGVDWLDETYPLLPAEPLVSG